MERLTFEGNFCDIAQCVGEYRMTSECADGPCSQRKVWERLKEYEDTGLEPEDLALGLNAAARKKAGAEYYGLTPNQLDEAVDLYHANKEGRLVVLPCNEQAELTRDGKTFKANHWNHTLTAFRDSSETRSGKQVALFSIEEAEAALKGGAEHE